MLRSNKRRVAVWGGLAAVIASIVTVGFTKSTSRDSTVSAASSPLHTRVYPTYVLRSLEDCAGQRYLTETELFEGDRLLQEFLDTIVTVPNTGYGDPADILAAQQDDGDEQLTPEQIANYVPDPDYPPAYYAAIDPEGDHCENPIPDEFMMVDRSKLGPGSSTSTTTSTSTTVPATTTSTTSSTTTTTVAVPTTVSGCSFSGFFAPVDNAPTINVVKAGAAVPIKFGFCTSGSLAIFVGGSPSSSLHACGSAVSDPITETVTATTSGLSFASGRYQYNWKTDKVWAGQCRRLQLAFTDGSTRSAEFRFK